ncbi:MAG TPA: transcription-repair coupling factor [Burkholderiales bacterium]|nr:transcription-repair coupling factor [Burkholderiales bacterium]
MTTTTAIATAARLRFGKLHGSSDALALAQLAQARGPIAIVCAAALDAQRLREEIPWFAPALRVSLFPDWETLPYDGFSPHPDLVSERLETLYRITTGEADVTIVPAATALQRLPPTAYLAAHTFFVRQGARLDAARLRAQFTTAGYSHVTQVVAPGEYCVRGGLVDLFPMGSAVPYRIDLVDDEIESIRTFDVDTQRTIYAVREVRLLPSREFPLDDGARTRFRARFREAFEGDVTKSPVYKDISNGVAPGGIEYYLPLFFDATGTLFDYLPTDTTLVAHHDVHAAIDDFWRDARTRFQLLHGDRLRPLLPPEQLFLTAEQFFVAARAFERLDLHAPQLAPDDADRLATVPLPALAVERRAADPLHALKRFLEATPERVLLLAESPGRRETMSEYLTQYGLTPRPTGSFAEFTAGSDRLALGVAPLAAGFVVAPGTGEGWDELAVRAGFAVVTESELYAGTARARGRRDQAKQSSIEGMLRDLSELSVGDPVVHESHGIGRYRGLISLDLGEGQTEFLQLEYAGEDKLYVPVAQLHTIGRYSGGPPEAAPLHKLGGAEWEKAKRKAAAQVRDTAAELLALYAQRAARQGRPFEVKEHDLDAFAEGFGFEETADQAAAIQVTVRDMRTGKPMDRLVCGDVGFGKTEVALRAAFVAVADGQQVAVLAPTTLLAEQHFNTFSDRFADWPVRLAELSRFKTAGEQATALQGLAEGRIDIVIGTHKLLSRDVKFARLGLVIVDEEHRFGVRQKERLKQLRAEVDVLTLTATPIPRTLAMSLEGLRDLSVIATAPARRLAIKTFVTGYSNGIIREAAMRELKRGGQIYFLHNDVESIDAQAAKLAELVPEARIAVAHGQMRERELERVMREFLQQRSNLLVCSTIIETGIDIPTANTILINRADKFGLAQLHQLRGRVGRSHHQAYAYLLTPGEDAVRGNARKRLEAIQLMEELGSGFYLAMHDLEIRGAGEVLGEAQSGQMQEVGFNLYNDMLAHAVRSLKAGREPDLAQPLGVTTEINLHVPALLPAGYCSDVHERLVLYKRLANCDTDDALTAMQEELVDRFGPLPEPAQALLESHRLRILAHPLGVVRIDAAEMHVQIQFGPHPAVDPGRVIELVQRNRGWKLAGPTKLRGTIAAGTLKERAQAVQRVLVELRGRPV